MPTAIDVTDGCAGKPGSSPINLGWSARLRIARGVARGLAYLHDKKWVHGNVKPSNILLDADMEPLLADGAALAVRRIGSDDAGVRRFSELDAQMRAVAKLRHGNILRLRGFYWGADEKLLIHDYAPNGSLANIAFGSKSLRLPPTISLLIITTFSTKFCSSTAKFLNLMPTS